jgi:hypothetical protein
MARTFSFEEALQPRKEKTFSFEQAMGIEPDPQVSSDDSRSGFVPALKAGVSGVQEAGYALAGRTGLMDEAAAQKAIEEEQAYQSRVFRPTEEGFLEAPLTKTTELLGQSIPYMGAPLLAAGAAALAPLTGTAATVATLGAAGLASAGQFTGTNLLRQMEPTDTNPMGRSIGETELGNAALAAIPQAALDVLSFRMMPFIRGVFGQAGKDLSEEAARRIASKNIKDVAADYALATGTSMTAEGLTEAVQQSLERLQAGLSITDQAARDEYLESFIGGAVLGGVLAPPGRYLERRSAQKAIPEQNVVQPSGQPPGQIPPPGQPPVQPGPDVQPSGQPPVDPSQPPGPLPGMVEPEPEFSPEEEAELQAQIAQAGRAAPPTPITPTAAAPVIGAPAPPSPEVAAQVEALNTQLAKVQAKRLDPTLSPDDPVFSEFDKQEAQIKSQIQQLSAPETVVLQQTPEPVALQQPPETVSKQKIEPTIEDQVRAQKSEERRERQAEQEAKKSEFVLQNRDRSGSASLEQMQNIAKAPDYGRAGFSRTPDGAPIVSFANVAQQQLGRKDEVTTASGRKIPIQYAVVEADSVLASNDIQGRPNVDYGDKNVVGTRAIAGNGRITGLREAYRRGTAGRYIQDMANDSPLHGVSTDTISEMNNPVLVRIMPQEMLTKDIGDDLNKSSMLELSPVEQAKNDLNRVDFDAIEFDESGEINQTSLSQFINAQPVEERSRLVDQGLPTKQARQRLENAIFARAYNDDSLIAMFAQADDAEARLVINALAQVAPQMAKLEGAGDLDIRDIVTDAAKIIISGKRRGLKLTEIANQVDMTVDPDTRIIVGLFAQNTRSNKAAIEALNNAAEIAYRESIRPEEGLFGAEPKMERRELVEQIRRSYEPGRTQDVAQAQRPRPAPSDVERKAEPSAAAVPPADQGFVLTGQTQEELAELERKEKTGEAQREIEEREAKELADRARDIFTLERTRAEPTPVAPPLKPTGDMFGAASQPSPTTAPATPRESLFKEEEAGSAIKKLEEGVIRFASGMSSLSDLDVALRTRAQYRKNGVGVDVGLLSKRAVDLLAETIVNLKTPVFVDSGAFSAFTKKLRGKESPALDFDKILEKYDSITQKIDEANPSEERDYPRPMFVMPDIVGDQDGSVSLIEEHKNWISGEILGNLSQPIIPIQKGRLSLSEVYDQIKGILGSDKFIVGVPSQEEAISRQDLADFLAKSKPPKIHFLGAASARKLNPLLAIVAEKSPNTEVSADASKVRSAILGAVAKGKTREDAIIDALRVEDDPAELMEAYAAKAGDKAAAVDVPPVKLTYDEGVALIGPIEGPARADGPNEKISLDDQVLLRKMVVKTINEGIRTGKTREQIVGQIESLTKGGIGNAGMQRINTMLEDALESTVIDPEAVKNTIDVFVSDIRQRTSEWSPTVYDEAKPTRLHTRRIGKLMKRFQEKSLMS